MNTETVTVHQKGEDFEIIVKHDQTGSAYGITLSKNGYEQLRRHFVSGTMKYISKSGLESERMFLLRAALVLLREYMEECVHLQYPDGSSSELTPEEFLELAGYAYATLIVHEIPTRAPVLRVSKKTLTITAGDDPGWVIKTMGE